MLTPAVVITGAAGGIGREFAAAAARDSRVVFLVDRRAGPLEEAAAALSAAGATVHALALDLVDPTAGNILAQALAERGLACDVLVNNAGVGLLGPALGHPLQQALDVVALHVRAVTDLALRFLPGMVARRAGGIINVSSLVARLSGPDMAIYAATKAYIRAFSLAMADELAGTGVTMTCVYPSRVMTGFWDGLAIRQGRRFRLLPTASPRTVAEAGWSGFKAGRSTVVPTALGKLAAGVLPLAPRRLVKLYTRGMFPPPPAPPADGGGSRPAIVVTGASSGIGREIARTAAREGTDMVLVARSLPALESLAAEIGAAGTTAHVFAADLLAPGTVGRLEAFLRTRDLHADVVVNNAGLCLAGHALDLPLAGQLALLDLNVRAATEVALHFLPGMVRRGRGGLLNLGSLGAYMAAPKMAVYHASKAYLFSLSDALAGELAGTGVTVTCVNPGIVQTPMVEGLPVKRDVIWHLTPKSTPAFTAEAAWRGFRRGAAVVIPSLRDRALAHLFQVLPRRALPPLPVE